MNILINCSGRLAGGGLQVADSVCTSLYKFSKHRFVVVLSHYMSRTKKRLQEQVSANIKLVDYDLQKSFKVIVTGRNAFLDSLVERENIDCVLSIFGPILWVPKCVHVCGFARGHIVLPDSPYYTRFGVYKLFVEKMRNAALKYFFKRSTKNYFTENPYITARLSNLFKGAKVATITNYYNQVFDERSKQVFHEIPPFDGLKLLTISNYYPHKNLDIAIGISKYLKHKYPTFHFRFYFTIDKTEYPRIDAEIEDCFCFIGTVDISECPSLYEQCDIEFQPTLLECFTAAYPEAMRMRKPIITTDIEFARGLCGNAALYYNPLSCENAAETIFKLAHDKPLQRSLVDNGVRQLRNYDTYEERIKKMISYCEKVVSSQKKAYP